MLRSMQSLPPMRGERSRSHRLWAVLAASFLVATALPTAHAQAADPGPRGGPAAAGNFFSTLNADEQTLFNQAMGRFVETDSVTGTLEAGKGLGPTFNGNSCAQCHAQPAVGGRLEPSCCGFGYVLSSDAVDLFYLF